MSDNIPEKQLNNLKEKANSLIKQGEYRLAIKYYLQGLKTNRDDAELLNMLAVTLKLMKKNIFSMRIIKKAHKLSPNSVVILNNMGTILFSMNELTQAKISYERALSLQPNLKDTAMSLCRIYNRESNPQQGLTLIEEQLNLYPEDKALTLQKGLQLAILHQYQAAFDILSAHFIENQENENFLFSLAVCCYNLNKFFEAAELFKKCVEKNKNNASYWNYFALTQKHLKNRSYLEEIRCFRKAIALASNDFLPYQNIANTLISADKLVMAEKLLNHIIENNPQFTEAYVSLGYVHQLCGRFQLAEKYYLEAINQSADLAGTHTNLGLLYLSLGNFEQGWKEYEWRWQHADLQDIKSNFKGQRWRGESLENKTLMIFTEQGFGDTIQFVRYLPLINKSNGKVLIECREPLVELIKTAKGIDGVVPRVKPFPTYDFYIPLMSLPQLFETNLQNIPNTVPYLTVDQAKLKYWQSYFSQYGNKLKIGISWAGNPQHKHDRYRTINPELFSQLKINDNVSLFSLQKNISDDVCTQYGFINLADQLNDFTDTAACLSALDLIISVDTAIVHLAGALNLPVWTLLGFYCDWRWLKERTDSPWYPSMCLFRQPSRHNWKTPFEQIKAALNSY